MRNYSILITNQARLGAPKGSRDRTAQWFISQCDACEWSWLGGMEWHRADSIQEMALCLTRVSLFDYPTTPRYADQCHAARSFLSLHIKSEIPSGHEPHIMALFGNLPPTGASTFSLFFFSSISAMYMNPITLASRMFSCVSSGWAFTMVRIAFCICGDGRTLLKMAEMLSSVTSPGISDLSRSSIAGRC